MNIKEMRTLLGDTQSEFASRYGIPFRTIQNWETGQRTPPEYILSLLEQRVKIDSLNKRTCELPRYDSKKINLPINGDYSNAIEWLKAILEIFNEDVVFALDEALMCHGYFHGRNREPVIWVYGNDSLKSFNGVVVLGNNINSNDVVEKYGLKFTSFNRTIYDSLSNQRMLDMQGITEALSKYYYKNDETYKDIYIHPEQQEMFDEVAQAALEYYTN